MGAGTSAECVGCLGRDGDEQFADKPVSAERKQKDIRKSYDNQTLGHFVVDKHTSIADDYLFNKKSENSLGQGSFGAVFKATCRTTQAVRAVKYLELKTKFQSSGFEREMSLMTKVAHPNIIKLFETYRDGQKVYLVMELCSGGELFDRIIEEQASWTEKHAAILMRQILGVIHYLHKENIVHRDIKPENFLFLNKDPIEKSVLKIIDFGLSRAVGPDEVLTTKAGTAYYIAPQVLDGKYDKLADVWSCGILMYIFLCGYPPFGGAEDAEVFIKIRLGKFTYNPAHWGNISEDAKNLINRLLAFNPATRIHTDEALNDTWIRDMAPKAKDEKLSATAIDQLRTFRNANKLKKAALHIIARQVSEEKLTKLRDTFMALDENGDGELSIAELREGIHKVGVADPKDFEELLKGIDVDGSGTINYTEFLASMLTQQDYLKEDMCLAAFRVFDVNGDGKITAEELQKVLESQEMQEAKDAGGAPDLHDFVALMKEVDTDGDGEIDFQEFMQMMRGQKATPS